MYVFARTSLSCKPTICRAVFVGKESLLLCGVSDDRCIGFTFVRWLFGGCMVGLLVILFVTLLLSFSAMHGLCCFLRVLHGESKKVLAPPSKTTEHGTPTINPNDRHLARFTGQALGTIEKRPMS